MSDPSNPFASPLAADQASVDYQPDRGINVQGLGSTRTGLLLVYIAICGFLLSGIGFGIAIGVGGPAGPAALTPLLLILGISFITFYVLQLVGIGVCIGCPIEAGARPLAAISLGLQILGLLLSIIASITNGGDIPQAAVLASNIAGLAAVVCFLLFMRKIAFYIGRPDIAARTPRILLIGGFAFASTLGGIVTVGALGQIWGLLTFVGLIAILVTFLMYANMVTYLRKGIGEALQKL